MKTTVLAAMIACAALVGCNKDGGGDAEKSTSDSKASSGAAKVCEDFFAANKKCIDKAIAGIPDQAMKDQTKKTMEEAEKQWKDMLKDPASAAAAESGCKAALDGLKNNPACK
jgi:hypothetical protein